MKTYKIGEIAKMLGISSETIRNYEKKGLINPYKEEDSNYRYYDIIQINHLMNVQKFQKYGYSLHEIKNLMKDTSMLRMEISLAERQGALQNQVFLMNLKLNSIHEDIHCMMQAQNAQQGFFIGERPALYRLNYQRDFELLTQVRIQEELVKWLKYEDLAFMSGSVSLMDLESGACDFDFGFCIDKRTAEYINIKENDVVKYYEACPAIVFYYEATPFSDMQTISAMVMKYVKEKNLRICGESISRVIFANWQKDNYFISHLVWMPIEKMK